MSDDDSLYLGRVAIGARVVRTGRDAMSDDDREIITMLMEALDHLIGVQNGPPLQTPRHIAEWQAAMDMAEAALLSASAHLTEAKYE